MGKFVEIDDVTSRYEGQFPTERESWVDLRIGDVESELMGQVPSLRKSIDEINAESTAAGDADRINRVKRLVCDKVLDLYRNPQGVGQHSITTPDITISDTFGRGDNTRGRVAFTADQLDSVKLRRRRSQFGTIPVAPWRPARDLHY